MTTYLQEKTLFPPFIEARVSNHLGLVVVIPCHDEDGLLQSLLSLHKCTLPHCDVEIIVVINDAENAPKPLQTKNLSTFELASQWAQKHSLPRLKFHILYKSGLPKKHAGVGLARKIGMDEACWRFEKVHQSKGIIACFDADSRCEKNYFIALENHFKFYPKAQACGIYFEHPLEGFDFDEKIYSAITDYELHLRYYVHAQRWAGFPHAFQTIGSSMAVRCEAYQKQGGMNRRQAGEDFYFLHKFIPLGHFQEINSTKIIPSPRPSHRVPFGTGKAVHDLIKSGNKYMTYNPRSFVDLRVFLKNILPGLYAERPVSTQSANRSEVAYLPESIARFLSENNFENKLSEIRANTAGEAAFMQRFFRWFDAFMVMKYVHFARDNYYEDVPINEAANWLLKEVFNAENIGDEQAMLFFLRKIDRSNGIQF